MSRLTPVLATLLLLASCNPEEGGGAPKVTALTPATHDALFPIAYGTHAGTDCQACHGDFDTFSQFTCVGCHAHAQATVDPKHFGDLAPGYSWGPQTCYQCHPRGVIAAFDHGKRFPIGPGTVHDGITCGSCHTDRSSRAVFSCVGCHTDAATTPRHGLVAGYRWESAACYSCHPDATVPTGGTDHSTKFPIGPGTKHAGVACATCHVDPANRKVFSCTGAGCHTQAATDPTHAAVAGYAWASASCYGCHPQATIPAGGVNHVPFFPIAAGDRHAGISCASCHPNAADRKVFTCTACHTHDRAPTDLTHTGVPNYSYDSAACYRCHPRANVVGLINHAPFFPIAAGQAHQNLSCASCHTVPGNRQVVNCASTICHPSATMTTEHSPVGGYSYTSSLCLRCHADAQVSLVTAHLPFRIQSGSKHYRRACLSCHPASRTDKPYGANFLRAQVACASCHRPASKQHFNRAASTCLAAGCHPDGRKP